MSKKHSFRRYAAGILAVLTVTGNMIAPAQIANPLAPASIEAEAAYLKDSTLNPGFVWDAATQTLTITRGISNADGVVGQDKDDELNFNWPNRINIGSFFSPKYLSPSEVKNIVIANGAELPESCQQLFSGFTNLETFKIESTVDASRVYNIESMFEGLDKLTEVDFGGLTNTSNIDYIDNMFTGCSSLTKIDLSMLDGSNVGKRNWTGHKAIEHIRRAVAGCSQLRDLDLTGEFLDHCVKNIKTDIDTILDEILKDCDSPYVNDIRAKLLEAYRNYVQAAEDQGAWHPLQWSKWKSAGDGYTCTLTLQRVVNGVTEYDYTAHEAEVTFVDDPAATCTKDGKRIYTAKWTNEKGVVFTNSKQHSVDLDRLGHDYELKNFEWSVSEAGVVSCKAIIMCQRDKCGQMSEQALTPTKVGHVEATCTDPAHDLYEVTYQGTTDRYAVVTGEAAGHDYEFVKFNWSDDFTSATAELKCSKCGETKEEAVTVTPVTFAATCTAAGRTEYTAVYGENTETKTVAGEEASGHNYEFVKFNWSDDFTSATVELKCSKCGETKEEAVTVTPVTFAATCTAAGRTEYTAVYGENTETKTVEGEEASGHNYEFVKFNWSDDFTSATVELKCSKCGETKEEAVTVTPVAFAATCTAAGRTEYTAVYGENTETKTVAGEEASGHDYEFVKFNWSDDFTSATVELKCSKCGETKEEAVTVTPVTFAATCTAAGRTEYTAVYGENTETKTVAGEEASGHDYEFVKFNWSDDFTSATVELKCSKCGETKEEAVTVTPVTFAATCTAAGRTEYTAVYGENTETKTVAGEEASGHDYEFVKFNWSDDFTSATVELKCSKCGETKEEAVTVTPVTFAATCTAAGRTEYTAVYGENTETKTVEGEEALGHAFGEPAWRWADDYLSAALVSACVHEGCTEEDALAADVVLDTADIRYIEANDVHGGVDVYKATVIVDGETYVDEQLVETEKLSEVITAATRTLQLEGRVVVNWYAKYCEGITSPQMQIVDESGNVLSTVEGVYVTKGNYAGRYLFSYDVAAKEMSDETYVKFIGVRGDETVSTVKSYGYSVRTYCENKLADESASAELKELCAALLTYGAAAQTYFDYQIENLADANLDELYGSDYTVDKSVIESSTAKGQRVALENATVTIKNPSLLLESGTTVRFYTNLNAETAEGAFLAYRASETEEFSYAPIKCITSGNGTFYVGEIENIVAKDLTDLYEVYVCTADENGTYTQVSDTLFYGPEAYAVSQYNKSGNPETLKELVAAMMDYCAKAKAFFNSQNS